MIVGMRREDGWPHGAGRPALTVSNGSWPLTHDMTAGVKSEYIVRGTLDGIVRIATSCAAVDRVPLQDSLRSRLLA